MKPFRLCGHFNYPAPTETEPYIGNGPGSIFAIMPSLLGPARSMEEWKGAWRQLDRIWQHSGLAINEEGTAELDSALGMPMGLLRDKLNRAADSLGLLED